MPSPSASRYTFTLNNYDEAELVALRQSLQAEAVRYAVFGREVGAEGTPHLQGYLSFRQAKTFTGAKKVVGHRAHVEVAVADEATNRTYCTKDGDFEEFGTRAAPGKRTDINLFQDAVKAGLKEPSQIREEFPEIAAKYPRFVQQYVRDQQPLVVPRMHALLPWQAYLVEELRLPAPDREIIFIVDREGNKGKSWFTHYYSYVNAGVYVTSPAKKADMIYALYMIDTTPRVVFIDAPRCRTDDNGQNILPYEFLENLKDGAMLNTKYTSEYFRFPPPHVVVMMNQRPNMEKLSADRYVVREI